jgi:uracil-DNA glycosylase
VSPAERPADITAEMVVCRRCLRLVEWREAVARERVARFAAEPYWGRPVPGFGDPGARVIMVGLAPAAHGGNRTGRVFTGDRSGDFLFAALHRAGFANQPTSVSATDGLRLTGLYLTAVNRCAPPANRPTPAERDACLPFLVREIDALPNLRVIVALGSYAWDGVLRAIGAPGRRAPRQPRRPRFGHAVEAHIDRFTLIGCFHPSQQNTFTGKLTAAMIDAVLVRAHALGNP